MSNSSCDLPNAVCAHAAGTPSSSPSSSDALHQFAREASVEAREQDEAWQGFSALRMSEQRRPIDAWALVLVSKGIESFISFADGVFTLRVVHADVARARAELSAADAEEHKALRDVRDEAGHRTRPATRYSALGGVALAALLLAFFALTGSRASGSIWFTEGAADAERVLQHGEWWRAVTALTLHADGAHVASNVGIAALVVAAVMRSEGVGFGAALVLAAGTAGNLLNAWAHQAQHSSVGFSTAVFGAIGLLGGLSYARGRGRKYAARPAWTALAASLALLAMLGASERSDLFAHLFGGLAGVFFGVVAGWAKWRPTTAAGQWFAGLGSAAVVLAAWSAALH
jgi:rhomboid protease GluP